MFHHLLPSTIPTPQNTSRLHHAFWHSEPFDRALSLFVIPVTQPPLGVERSCGGAVFGVMLLTAAEAFIGASCVVGEFLAALRIEFSGFAGGLACHGSRTRGERGWGSEGKGEEDEEDGKELHLGMGSVVGWYGLEE